MAKEVITPPEGLNLGKVIPIAIEDEVKTAYINYAMSVTGTLPISNLNSSADFA